MIALATKSYQRRETSQVTVARAGEARNSTPHPIASSDVESKVDEIRADRWLAPEIRKMIDPGIYLYPMFANGTDWLGAKEACLSPRIVRYLSIAHA